MEQLGGLLRGTVPEWLSGYGCGSGYGSGYGSGDGDRYWHAVAASGCALAEPERARLAALVAEGATIALWKSDHGGRPCNGGSGTQARVGLVEEIKGPLRICTASALHATNDPTKYRGERLWVVALFGEVAAQGDKVGALRREFVGEIRMGEQATG